MAFFRRSHAERSAPGRPGEELPKRVRTRRAWLANPIPILDRYVAAEMIAVVFFCILGFAILIVGNNFYANAEFIFGKYKIPIQVLALLSVLEAPASMVRSLPLATTFGVMLAIGRMGRDSEIIAMRSGGASLGRILIPVLFVGMLLSVANYYAAEKMLPAVGKYADQLRREYVSKQDFAQPRDVFFRDPAGRIIYTSSYNKTQKTLTRPFLVYWDKSGTPDTKSDDKLHYWTANDGRFEGDELLVGELEGTIHQVFGWNAAPGFDGWELWYKEELEPGEFRLPFPASLQDIVEDAQSAEYQSASDISATAQRMQTVGKNPTKVRAAKAFKLATPVACSVFAFVAFIFGMVNPRREKFTGVFYALVTIFWYYILNAIFRNLGDSGMIRPPELAAWATNIIFFVLASLIFMRMR